MAQKVMMPTKITEKLNGEQMKHIPQEELSAMIQKALDVGITQKQIAEHFNVSVNTIARKIDHYWDTSLTAIKHNWKIK